jgi:uncharacterized protein
MTTIASRYNVTVPCPDGGTILYNQVSGALLVLDAARREEYDALAAGMARPGAFFAALVRGQFLVDATGDERTALKARWDRVVSASEAKGVTIIPTDRCNLGCTYCYESKHHWEAMSEELQARVLAFVLRLMEATPTRQLGVTWFGGEPTLHMKCIEWLSRELIAGCAARKISYVPFIVTNGTNLTPYVLERLKTCRIGTMQITVDGPEEVHDARRPYLRDVTDPNEAQRAQLARIGLPILGQAAPRKTSSFVPIMTNIRTAREMGFQVQLRMNVDRTNMEGIRTLLRRLRDDGLLAVHPSGGRIMPYPAQVFDGCAGCAVTQTTRAEHAEFEVALRKEGLLDEPWHNNHLRFTGKTCTANMHYDFIINQRGELTKCLHHGTDGRHTMGTVDDLELAERGTAATDPLPFDPLADAECRDCHVLPLCMGGCKSNNQFSELGYAGKKDGGCHAVRYTLPDHVLHVYRMHRPSGR